MVKPRILRIPRFGRVALIRGEGEATTLAGQLFATKLIAEHWSGPNASGKLLERRDCGDGVVTNLFVAIGAALMAGQLTGLAGGLSAFNYGATGTGTTAAAITDYQLQTSAGPSPVAGTQSNTSVPGTAQFQSVFLFNYTSTLAITEFGLFNGPTLSSTLGSPFTATSSSGGTVTGTPLTSNAYEGYIVVAGSALGIIASNTSSALSLTVDGWLAQSNDGTAGSTPSSTATYTLQPALGDHRIVSAFNVVSGNSIQFTYQLTWTPGG